ncbi:hypothetical protein [Dapis sp. BLCC M172]
MTVNDSFNTAMNRVVDMTDDRKLCSRVKKLGWDVAVRLVG